MEQHNFGANFYIRQQGEPWVLFDEMHLREATEYEWRWDQPPLHIPLSIVFFRMPLSYRQTASGICGNFTTPFQCGQGSLELCGEQYDTYLYPDSRKMTEQQFGLMMTDICTQMLTLNRWNSWKACSLIRIIGIKMASLSKRF